MTIKKARKGPTENRAGSWPCGQKVFSVLNFCFFGVKIKEVAPAAMSRQNMLLKQEFVILRYAQNDKKSRNAAE